MSWYIELTPLYSTAHTLHATKNDCILHRIKGVCSICATKYIAENMLLITKPNSRIHGVPFFLFFLIMDVRVLVAIFNVQGWKMRKKLPILYIKATNPALTVPGHGLALYLAITKLSTDYVRHILDTSKTADQISKNIAFFFLVSIHHILFRILKTLNSRKSWFYTSQVLCVYWY